MRLLDSVIAPERGPDLLVGGSASFTSTGFGDDDDDRVTSILVNPSVHYFLIPRLALGGSLTLRRQSFGDDAVTALGLGPRAAYFEVRKLACIRSSRRASRSCG